MTSYDKENEIMARECNIQHDYYCNSDNSTTGYWFVYGHTDKVIGGWTIEDAICREKIREKLEIDTIRASYDKGIAKKYWYTESSQHPLIEGQGKTIEEAEKECKVKFGEHFEGISE